MYVYKWVYLFISQHSCTTRSKPYQYVSAWQLCMIYAILSASSAEQCTQNVYAERHRNNHNRMWAGAKEEMGFYLYNDGAGDVGINCFQMKFGPILSLHTSGESPVWLFSPSSVPDFRYGCRKHWNRVTGDHQFVEFSAFFAVVAVHIESGFDNDVNGSIWRAIKKGIS